MAVTRDVRIKVNLDTRQAQRETGQMDRKFDQVARSSGRALSGIGSFLSQAASTATGVLGAQILQPAAAAFTGGLTDMARQNPLLGKLISDISGFNAGRQAEFQTSQQLGLAFARNKGNPSAQQALLDLVNFQGKLATEADAGAQELFTKARKDDTDKAISKIDEIIGLLVVIAAVSAGGKLAKVALAGTSAALIPRALEFMR